MDKMLLINLTNKESIWTAPFRWHCQQDNGRFEPYNDIMNELLEKIYEHWKLHDGPAEIETPLLTRFLDDISETYKINFQKNRQTNTRTFYQQAIDRRLVSELTNNRNWFYCNEHATWMRYEQMVENNIEQAFQFYRSDRGSTTIDIQFPGHPETYQINFLKGQQTNKTTYKIKKIKRE
jgi:hypothetical protein